MFNFNNLGVALDTNLKFYTSVTKGLKLKVKKFWGPITTFVDVIGENLVKEHGGFLRSPILNGAISHVPGTIFLYNIVALWEIL